MLAIRMQRTGRKGHAMFRMVVQDSRRTPTSGKVVAQLGSYDPHAKTLTLDKEKAGFYLEHGAQPSDRVVVLLKQEGVALPAWVTEATKKERSVRNPDKRRSTRPAEPEAETTPEEVPAETADTTESSDTPAAETTAEEPAQAEEAETPEETPAEEPKTEEPAEAAEDDEAEKPAE